MLASMPEVSARPMLVVRSSISKIWPPAPRLILSQSVGLGDA
jgi:hypothetical protein